MEVGENDRKKPEAEIPWIPSTPVKPLVPKSAPICTPKANGAFACVEFSHGGEKNKESHDGIVPAAAITDIGGENGKICDKTGSENVSCWSGLGFNESLIPTEVASANSCATQLGNINGLNDLLGNINGLNDLFVSSGICDNLRDPHRHEISDNACCSKRNYEDDPAKKLNKDGTSPNKELYDPVEEFAAVSSQLKEIYNPDEGNSLWTGLNKTPEKKPRRKKHRPKVIREVKPKRTPKPATPKPAQAKENTTGKRKYVRRKGLNTSTPQTEVTSELADKIPEATKMSCQRSLYFDIETKDESSTGRENENPTALLDGVAVQETNFGPVCDLNTSVKHASSGSMSSPEDTQAPDTSSQSTSPGAKSKENPTGKKKRVRRKMNKTSAPSTEMTGELTTEKMCELAEPTCKSSINFDKGGGEESSAVKENATIYLSKENEVTDGTNPDVSLTEDTQATKSSSRMPHEAKPKKSPSVKRQYVRRSGLNKSSTPTEVSGDLPGKVMQESAITSCRMSINFDRGANDESSADRENGTVHPCKETGAGIQEIDVGLDDDVQTFMNPAVENNYLSFCNNEQTPTVHPCKETAAVMQEVDVGISYDMKTFMKQATENNYMSFCSNEQNSSTSLSQTNPLGDKSKEKLTGNKYERRKRLNKSPICQTKMTGELTGPMMPDSKETPMRRFSDFDMGTEDESSACRQVLNVHIGDAVEETPVGLAYNKDTWMKQALHSYMPLPEEAQAQSTCPSKGNHPGAKPKENSDGGKKCVRKKRSKMTSTPTKRTGELTEPIMSEPTTISCRMSINFDKGGRDESYMCNESLTSDQNTLLKEILHNCTSLSESTQPPSTCLPESNSPGAEQNARNKNKRKGLAAAEDGNISNSQVSTIKLQMVGCEREHAGTIEHADNSSMNLIGAHYNGLASYQSKFPLQFPNIQKKRRTEKGKTSNSHITSSVITENGVPLIFAPEDAQMHPYASNYNSWMYDFGYNAPVFPIINECRENYIHNTQTFDEFRLSLRRVTERSQFPAETSDYNSLTRIRNFIEPNYTANQLDFSDQQTISDAERPQTCIDVLVEDVSVSCVKKKRNRKRSALSSSTHPNTDQNQMQQYHNVALGNHHLALGKSSATARGGKRKKIYNVEALVKQFRQLNINAGVGDIVLYKQNALVPFQGSFDPIKKQRPRPKVDLDEETDRVWKLLLLDINHDGVDGTDEEKAKWWEEERKVFRGRADSFIARMHLVQGDRRFSRWKGSVVDSVVGVFLTQNVTDHLSSSAFMSLAARFPKKSGSTAYDGEGTSQEVNKQQVDIVELEENTECDVNLLNQSVCNQSSMTIDIIEHSGEKAVNSNDSCRITSSPISLTDESNCKLTESPQSSGPMVMIEEGEEKSCYDGAGKELNDIVSSQSSVISSQISGEFSNDQNPEKIGSCSDSNSEVEDLSSTAKYNNYGSFCKLLEMVSSTKFYEIESQRSKSTENMRDVTHSSLEESIILSHECNLRLTHNSEAHDTFKAEASSSGISKNKHENEMITPSFQTAKSAGLVEVTHSQTIASQVHPQEQTNHMQQNFFNSSGQTHDLIQNERDLNLGDHKDVVRSETNEISSTPIKVKTKSQLKEEQEQFDWDSLRIKAQAKAGKREKTENTMDSLDWDAVRCADVGVIADTIKERGMNNRLAERIQKFLNRVVDDHGSIDLEWLRDVPPDQAKEYLLSVRGLGLKSVECVRLLTLHHLAFPVDTNVGRIAVRLGWVPLQPLPESLQLHLLEMYPVLESIQKYLWPRLCKLDQKTLYELHYQMITFGKVFCTKSKPNCNACPMRAECRHFASAFASARLALPGPEQKSMVSVSGNGETDENPPVVMSQLHLPLPENTNQVVEEIPETEVSGQLAKSEVNICQPIIEEPTTPEPECSQLELSDMEDAFYDDPCEIPTIKLNMEEFTLNLQNYMQQNMELQEGEMSKALVALHPEAASIPGPKLKNVSRLRTEHCVYELPDKHPLLEGWEKREPDDPGKYLLAIWTPGETADSTQAPECKCNSREECGQLCNEKECFSCNSFREANSQIVRGTLLIPCRTAMRGSFPLNGTYFQVNEVFADHGSSINPVSVPRSWIWNLNRRTVYFGTSTTSIFKGLSTQEIQQAFWRGYICVRGFERETRTPRPLMARLHFPASKLPKTNEKTKKESTPAKEKPAPKPKQKPGPKPKQKAAKNSQGTKPDPENPVKNSPEQKPNPEQPELISNGHCLQEKGTA